MHLNMEHIIMAVAVIALIMGTVKLVGRYTSSSGRHATRRTQD